MHLANSRATSSCIQVIPPPPNPPFFVTIRLSMLPDFLVSIKAVKNKVVEGNLC